MVNEVDDVQEWIDNRIKDVELDIIKFGVWKDRAIAELERMKKTKERIENGKA